ARARPTPPPGTGARESPATPGPSRSRRPPGRSGPGSTRTGPGTGPRGPRGGPSEQRSPGELGLVAEQAPSLVDAEQGAVLGQTVPDGHPGKHLGHQLAAGTAHDGV